MRQHDWIANLYADKDENKDEEEDEDEARGPSATLCNDRILTGKDTTRKRKGEKIDPRMTQLGRQNAWSIHRDKFILYSSQSTERERESTAVYSSL